jgi:hypothetical protein
MDSLGFLTGKLAVSNRTSHNVVALDLTANTYSEIGKTISNGNPWMHKVGPDGLLYIAYKGQIGKVATVDPSKDEAPTVILTGLKQPMDIGFDATGNLYVLCRGDGLPKLDNTLSGNNGTIYKYPKGNFTNSGQTRFATFEGYKIFAMEFDKSGNLLVTKSLSDAISGIDKVASDGTITHIIGGIYYNGSDINIEDGVPGDPSTARFNDISTLTLDSNGNIYLIDSNYYIKFIKLGTSGYSDATVESICGKGMVTTLAAGNGDILISSDDSKLYFTTPASNTTGGYPVYVINLK